MNVCVGLMNEIQSAKIMRLNGVASILFKNMKQLSKMLVENFNHKIYLNLKHVH